MTDNTAYALGFAHGYRKQPYLDKFFEATVEYFQYKQGYTNGVHEAKLDKEAHDKRTRHQRLASPATCTTLHRKAKDLHQMA